MELFDYGSIKEEHKQAVMEVMELARASGNDVFAEFLKHKFKIEEPVKIDYKQSEFYKHCVANDIKVWNMGWVQDGGGNKPEEPYYPVVSITEDIRVIEKLMDSIKNSK
jgi:hypothetical protein